MGIKCLVSTSFAEIFKNNCFKNGMLPIVLDKEQVQKLFEDAAAEAEVTVDLKAQNIVRPSGEAIAFEVDAFRKHCLINGLDDIGLTLQKIESIAAFEADRSAKYPWLDGASA